MAISKFEIAQQGRPLWAHNLLSLKVANALERIDLKKMALQSEMVQSVQR